MSIVRSIHVTISAHTEPLLRLRRPVTGDQEQMLTDMRQVEPLPRDPFDRMSKLFAENLRRAAHPRRDNERRSVEMRAELRGDFRHAPLY